ncbi:MAG: hypothetical protein R2831_02130 [Chitinophagaceae bacterium]
MKYLCLFILLFHISMSMQAQDYVREIDKKTGQVLLRGQVSFDEIADETSCQWLYDGAKDYMPNEGITEQLNRMWGNYQFVVFMGTWCEDTRMLLPAFYKTLLMSGVDMHAVKMYGVDRNKEALNIEHQLYNISRVPTIIIMHQYREVGRIVESVDGTIEETLLAIIEKDYMKLQAERAAKQ